MRAPPVARLVSHPRFSGAIDRSPAGAAPGETPRRGGVFTRPITLFAVMPGRNEVSQRRLSAIKYTLKIAAAILLVSSTTALATLQPRRGEQVAVVFLPWVDCDSIDHRIWNAGGSVLSNDGFTAIALGASDDFFKLLRRNGALGIFDAAKVRALCGVSWDA